MIFRGPHPDVSAPNLNVAEFVLGDISAHKNKTAIIQAETKREISYQELSDSINRLAAGLQVNGFKKGDVLAIYSPNLPEYVVVFLAVLKLGGICTTVNPLYTAQELSKQLIDANAKIVVTVSAFLDKAKTATHTHPVEEIILIGNESGYRNLTDLMQNNHELSDHLYFQT